MSSLSCPLDSTIAFSLCPPSRLNDKHDVGSPPNSPHIFAHDLSRSNFSFPTSLSERSLEVLRSSSIVCFTSRRLASVHPVPFGMDSRRSPSSSTALATDGDRNGLLCLDRVGLRHSILSFGLDRCDPTTPSPTPSRGGEGLGQRHLIKPYGLALHVHTASQRCKSQSTGWATSCFFLKGRGHRTCHIARACYLCPDRPAVNDFHDMQSSGLFRFEPEVYHADLRPREVRAICKLAFTMQKSG